MALNRPGSIGRPTRAGAHRQSSLFSWRVGVPMTACPTPRSLADDTLPVLARYFRGSLLEAQQRGAICVVDGDGKTVLEVGPPGVEAFLRSAAKPVQLLPLLRRGLHDRFDLQAEDLAVMMASHSGEPRHTKRVRHILKRTGLAEGMLRCGPHLPVHAPSAATLLVREEEPTPIHNNCSGKHTGMLAVVQHEGWDAETYTERGHPLQQEIEELMLDLADTPQSMVRYGRDGCSVVTFGVALWSAARIFSRLAVPESASEALQGPISVAMDAFVTAPLMVGGTGRFDSALMKAGRGRFVSKVGAEGLQTIGVRPCPEHPRGLGIAIKLADGDLRGGRPFVACGLLKLLGLLGGDEDGLEAFQASEIRNCRKLVVGKKELSTWAY